MTVFIQFLQDCSDVMQLLLKHQTSQDELADDDPQVVYIFLDLFQDACNLV